MRVLVDNVPMKVVGERGRRGSAMYTAVLVPVSRRQAIKTAAYIPFCMLRYLFVPESKKP